MEIVMAKTAGFCFGVDKAVKIAYENAKHKNVYTYGPIIHNTQLVDDLSKNGVEVINSLEDIHTIIDGKLIVRSHGVSKDVFINANDKFKEVIDATCPFVKRIHKIVEEYSEKGYIIIVIGNETHPEIEGIIGWTNTKTYIINSKEEALQLELNNNQPVCVVSQTTFNATKFEEMVEIIKKKVYDVIVFNTICSATHNRQNEALQIAKKVKKMIIIGGKHSSNTQKLYEICKSECKKTYHIETINDIDLSEFKADDVIGITAGASTPNNIIEEVIFEMSKIEEENSFEKLLEESLFTIHNGKIVKGTVIDVNENEIILNIGYKSDGIISKSDYSNYPDVDLKSQVKVGDELEAKVYKVNDGDGQVLLTHKQIAASKGYKKLEEAEKNKEVLTSKVVEVLPSGVVVVVEEARVFIPASLVSEQYEKDLKVYLNQEIDFQIIEFSPKRKRIIGSRKQLLKAERQKKQKEIFENIEVGQVVEGRVKNITDFGAFIDLGGADGLLHISEMSWGRIQNPNKLLKEDEIVKVFVKDINQNNKKISLSLKFPEANPWNNAIEKFAVGNVVKGKVARMTDFGAFIEILPGVDALLHVSQISKEHVEKPSDALKVGQEVEAKIIDFKEEEKKISLSIKALEEPTEEQKEEDNQEA
ncbi:4-hydroxy-3-methylbut-2-enyl diphosphate reductase [Natranaerovirga hydrolytica]|uniref:4-hydroxy-3-methylbut-2-enyl diphosphate reductase n=1 Tax=Natranaerovirga hydrolytica TaxID=680378 RepID=A0A4R1MXR2_9FIRM|nr:bifunctional 4-hydroxy-3-methylbut-2-enyl diphosphate reductase/30S ribosomal protein S1 [Natranaerovirga hydrolytica]TCK97996.1 4-hydroxy-3-methylbut-2-enyl diphosphate reductase [Natranaerovirga hydrolytica]